MKHSRVALWLFAILLLLGQQASLLHHLGHSVNDVAHLVAAAGAASENDTAPQPAPDAHVSNCPLCVGFGATGAAVPVDLRFDTRPLLAAFARPLGEFRLLSIAESAAKPIRGPPARLSHKV